MKIIKIFLCLMCSVFFINVVYANDIEKINMDIYVDKYGSAHIKETWYADLDEGTEGYKPYYNLGKSNIIDFKVSLNGKEFITQSNWDVEASFNMKKYKAGINKVSDGYELCFGISEYGDNVYKLEYTITNFVSELEDADMIYWQLIPYELSDKPESVYIKIYSDFKYEDSLPVWGFGNYGGYAYVYDGYIELVHEDSLDSDEYMTVLVKFPKNTFQTQSIISENFDYYLNMAEEGATAYKEAGNFLANILSVITSCIPFILIFFTIKNARPANGGTFNLKLSKEAEGVKDAPYFRDIPCDKDVFQAYWVALQYKLVKNKTDFLGAILLKWIRDKNVESISAESGILKKKSKAIRLLTDDGLSPLELELYNMIKIASKDGVLESNEFISWCKKNYKRILEWFDSCVDKVTYEFMEKGDIFRKRSFLGDTYYILEGVKPKGLAMAGLKKFLSDFSNIANRETIEVHLWNEYLIYAQIFGIAKKVAEELKKLYPDVLVDDVYNDVIFINYVSTQGVNAASSAKSRAESYSAGGGGFSSGGGGGGSFGGGGGGGGFR